MSGFRINTNVASINTRRGLNKVNRSLARTFERLSSGLRINSARDDAAGLAITDRFQSQIRSLNQATRNANDGVSLSQVAEAAMAEQTNILMRMRELAVQASNDTYTTSDRVSIQAEVDQLVEELNRIGNNTQFNNTNLLDGSFGAANIQVGAHAGQVITMSMTDARATALGATANKTSAVVNTDAFAGTGDLILSRIVGGNTVQVNIDATTAAMDTVSSTQNDASAIAKAAAINLTTGQHGVSATADTNTVTAGSSVAAGSVNGGANSISINGVNIGAVNVLAGDSDAALRNAINARTASTGVVASLSAGNEIVLTARDGRNVDITSAGTANAQIGETVGTNVYQSTITLASDGEFDISGTVAGLAAAGLASEHVNIDMTNVVSNISMTDQSSASASLTVLDSAISQVASRRGYLGALQNRLEATVSNLEAVVENYAAASSRIRDADFAAETAEMTRAQIVQQAATAMLAQANQAPQGVLSLLR